MTRNRDGSVILAVDDVIRLTALIAALDRKVKTPGIYTSESATEFVRRWDAREAAP